MINQQQPLLDIVVPVHGQANWVDLCIRSVEWNTTHPYRLILVDNASPDAPTQKVLAEAEDRGHTVVRLPENKSFSNACNVGVRAGKAPNIVLLNSDALVTPGYDKHFLQDLSDKTVGISGARSNAAGGLQSDSTTLGNFVEPKYLVFICVAIRRESWEAVGGMDEATFQGFGAEDLDFSWTIRKAGGRLKLSNAYAMHGLSQTIKTVIGDIEAQTRNNEKWNWKLIEKWGLDFVKANTKVIPNVAVFTFSAEEMTRVAFLSSLIGLRTSTAFSFNFRHVTRLPIQMAREAAAQEAIDRDQDWALFLDDDMTYEPNTLERLMKHTQGPHGDKVDVVSALAYGRRAPYMPCLFKKGDGFGFDSLEGTEHTGLRKVDATGLACSLIRVDAFKKLKASGVTKLFEFRKLGEDLDFCAKLAEIGGGIYCDTDLIVGHISDPIVVDERYRKAWKAAQK